MCKEKAPDSSWNDAGWNNLVRMDSISESTYGPREKKPDIIFKETFSFEEITKWYKKIREIIKWG